ncbi:CapA family protein [Modestobacter excelsi]|uniref:CapA family protein n=1 Tax=Modestobacter excelsi TaxID=2213161 RepID=UPI00110D13EB|nr:CapA family protein [Modestobacter excelsi]
MARRLVCLLAVLVVTGCSATPEPGSAAGGSTTSGPPPRTSAPAPVSTSPAQGPVTLSFAGDVHTAGRLTERFQQPETALLPVAPLLAGADLTVVNLETAVTDRGTAEDKSFTFRAPPSVFDALRVAGVDVVSMANNHGVDFGPVGLDDSLDAARQRGFPVVGLGADDTAAFAPYLVTLRGERIAVLAADQVADSTVRRYSAGPGQGGVASAFDTDRLLQAVASARQQADTVVVYLHWGQEEQSCPTALQRDLARQLSQAGADIVVGTHAHQLQGAGWLGRTYVAYGLGNFVWWRSLSEVSVETGVLDLTVDDGQVLSVDFLPARIDGTGIPQPRVGPDGARAEADFAALRACAGLSDSPG